MSQIYFTYEHKDVPAPIECVLEYEPAERGDRERGTGLQLEPDYDAVAYLESACVGGIEIVQLLSEEIVQEIEEAALRNSND